MFFLYLFKFLWSLDDVDLFSVIKEGAGLGDVDFGLSVLKVDINGVALDGLAVGGWVKDVAHLLAIGEGSVWHLDTLVVVSVGGGH